MFKWFDVIKKRYSLDELTKLGSYMIMYSTSDIVLDNVLALLPPDILTIEYISKNRQNFVNNRIYKSLLEEDV